MDKPRPDERRAEAEARLHGLGLLVGDLLEGWSRQSPPVKDVRSPHEPILDPTVITVAAQPAVWGGVSGRAHIRRINSETLNNDVDELIFIADGAKMGDVIAGWNSQTAKATEELVGVMVGKVGDIKQLVDVFANANGITD